MLPLGFAAFLVFCVVLVLVGANQAALARDLSLDLSLVSANSASIGGGILHALGTDLSLHRSRVVRNFSSDGKQIAEI